MADRVLTGSARSLSYAAQLRLSLLGLALPAVVLALLGWLLLTQSQYRVERGRIASDIYTALLVFDLEKSGLRSWSYRSALDRSADPAQRLERLDGMQAQISRIAAKAETAASLDRARGKILEEHAVRLALLAFLDDVVRMLRLETGALLDGGAADPAQIDADFDQLRGVSMAAALQEALSLEAAALHLERERADQSLAAARGLFVTAGSFGLSATLVMALLLARRLRQPLRQLDLGLRAYRAGDFSYRFAPFRDEEFAALGQQLNAMAAEVDLARTKAAQNRAALEQTVAARTAELRRTLDELAASEDARQQLLADIGHELRTPVTVIRGEAQVALRGTDRSTEPYRTALDRIVAVTRQMEHLIGDLLVLVRTPETAPLVVLRDMPLSEAIAPALETARSIAAQRDVTLHRPAQLPDTTVHADPDRLRQIITCLLDNALRYSQSGGTVTLEIDQTDPHQIALQITDTGIGIDTQQVHLVFDRGWRSEAARAHRPDGLGLGLAIAQRLTQAHSGQLEIRSGPEGKGTVAVLRLPVVAAEA